MINGQSLSEKCKRTMQKQEDDGKNGCESCQFPGQGLVCECIFVMAEDFVSF